MKRLFTRQREQELVREYLSGQGTLQEIAERERCDLSTFHKIVKRYATPEEIECAKRANRFKARESMRGIPRLQSTINAVRAALSKNQIKQTCPICGAVFGVSKSRRAEGKGIYCSRACYEERRRTTRPSEVQCTECSNMFLVYQYELRQDRGKYCSRACYDKAQTRRSGPDNPNWKGGRTYKGQLIRSRASYAQWRTAVFQRDKYTCQHCHKTGIYLEAHHIKSFADYPELRFDIANGVSLCLDCHNTVDPIRRQLTKSGHYRK